MSLVSRREALLGAAFGVCGVLLPSVAEATVVQGLSLVELSKMSHRILVGTALEANAHWETLGSRKRIVTDTRLRVDDVVNATTGKTDGEILVRTLGGTIGDIGALVHGEALISLQKPCVLFLHESQLGVHRVIGMAQGHYPVRPDTQKALRLFPSPQAPEVVGKAELAMHRLPGQELGRAKAMILEALRQ